ncbi:tyrosine-protein phosphatase [Brucepastera parasyntrophica]|uniref:tyrosine-protein phosphatase n=1 Tax=Brucepastera parasyntrophica TaxID=2880008 RepID=UPI00210D47D4|nr:tyrosine-protein phosphatase [Brucepastera parasyntrophica]ULQ60453.1 tyrosine-protein phosphatase [Brucepastera parasyntrophica]
MKKFILFFAICLCVFSSCENKKTMSNKPEFSGEDLAGKATIIRDKQTKKAAFVTDLTGPFELYSGETVEEIDFSAPLLKGEGLGIYELDVPAATRSYFQLNAKEGKAILAEQHLPMTGGYNFRDLGGYRSKNGKYVKWGKIFRSDEMGTLTPEDLTYLESIPIRTVVDFRSQSEIDAQPDLLPQSAGRVQLSISPGNLTAGQAMTEYTPEEMEGFMIEMNRLFVTDSVCLEQYRTFFRLLQSGEDAPLMFHCSAGKDRTGMAAALILFSLDVDEDTVIQDYLLSNIYLAEKYARNIEEHPQFRPMFEVRESYLKAGIDQIIADHGSVKNFLETVLDVDTDLMKSLYLY